MIHFTSIPFIQLGPFHLSTHALMMVFGILTAYILVRQEAKKRQVPLDIIDNLVNWAAIGGIIGARLGYVLLNPGSYHNVLNIFKIWQGGLVSFGGALGGFFAVLIYLRYKKIAWVPYADFLAPYVLLGWGIGRIGDFLAWEEIGTVTSMPWGVNAGFGVARHPVQLYTLITMTIGFFLTQQLKRTGRAKQAGFIFMVSGIYYFAERFLMEFLRDDIYGAAELVSYRFFAQIISIIFILALVVWFFLKKKQVDKSP